MLVLIISFIFFVMTKLRFGQFRSYTQVIQVVNGGAKGQV